MATPQDVIKELSVKSTPFDFAKQRREGEEYITGYTGAIGEQETLPAMYDRLSGQFGIPQLREQTTRLGEASEDLTSQLFALPEDVAGRTRESLVTESGKQRIIQAEADPMQKNLAQLSSLAQKFGTRLGQAESEVSTRMGMEMAQQEKLLMPWEKQYDLMNTMQAREFTGYTNQMQLELDRLIAKGTLTSAEADRANKLAIAELGFQNELDKIRLKSKMNVEEFYKTDTDAATNYIKSYLSGSGTSSSNSTAPSPSPVSTAPTSNAYPIASLANGKVLYSDGSERA